MTPPLYPSFVELFQLRGFAVDLLTSVSFGFVMRGHGSAVTPEELIAARFLNVN